MFGKNKEPKNKKAKKDKADKQQQFGLEPTVAKQIEQDIHVMPERFYDKPKTTNKALLITLGILGIALVFGGAAAVYFAFIAPQQSATPQQPTNQNINTSTNTNTNSNANTNTTTNQNTNTTVNTNVNNTPQQPPQPTNQNTNTSTNSNTNAGINANINSNTNVATPTTVTQRGVDTDNDGLTGPEEQLYGTDPSQSDTDGDGYRDGSEINNGYDPAAPGVSLLVSEVFTEFETEEYSMQHPTAWPVTETADATRFVAATGEYIETIIYTKDPGTSLLSWYQQVVQQQTGETVDQVNIGGNIALRTRNGQVYYFSNSAGDTIVSVQYHAGTSTTLNFITTFSAMVKSFQFN